MKHLLLVLGLAAALCLPSHAALADSSAKPPCKTPSLAAFTASDHAYAGDALTATVTLSCAPKADFPFVLTSDTSKLTVPATVNVRAGHSSVTIPLNPTGDYSGQYVAHLTVSAGTRQLSHAITVDPGLKIFELPTSDRPNNITPGVVLTGPAPVGGVTVQLASDNPAVEVPATVTVPQYASGISAALGVIVHPVAKDTTVHISAALGTRTLSAAQTLLPPFDGHSTMTITPEFSGDVYGLDYSRDYAIGLSNPAPDSGLTVSLKVRDDNPAITLESESSYITGGFINGYFRIKPADVTKTTYAVIDATVSNVTTSITVKISPRVTAIAIPATVKGGSSFQGTVTLAGPSDSDTQVGLAQSWGIVDIPVVLVIPAGQRSATFTGSTVPVGSDSNVTITATLGEGSAYAEFTVTP